MLDADYIVQNEGLDEAQAGIKVARRNINNLRYADVPPLEMSPSSIATNPVESREVPTTPQRFSLL